MATSRQAAQPSRWWRVLRGLFGGLRGIRVELARIADAQERLADGYEWQLRKQQEEVERAIQQNRPAVEGDLEVTYVNDSEQELWMECELALTRATGRAPSDEQIMAEYQRRLPAWVEAGGTTPGGVAPAPGTGG